MAQQLVLAKEVMEKRSEVFGYTTEDHVAWVFGLIQSAVLKSGKYHNGDIYRAIVKAVKPLYRAQKHAQKKSGKEAYELWYNIGVQPLIAVRNALATALATQQVATTT